MDALYRSWGILDLVGETVEAMPADWLAILDVARHLLDGAPLPGVELPDDLAQRVQRQEPRFTTTVRVERKRRVVYPVKTDTAVLPLRDFQDFPLIALPDLLLRDVDREVFEYRMVSGDIHGVYNVDPGPAFEDYDEVIEERIPVDEPRRRKRQKVYALLDVSNSMREENRLLFAKALMLAYLVVAREEGAAMYFRTFGNRVHERTDCLEPGAFPALARRILAVTPDGSTDIKSVLDAAIADIRGLDNLKRYEGLFTEAPTELLLVSDCESYTVPYIPPNIRLHTVHLGGAAMAAGYREGFERIRDESATFHELDTSRFRLPDTTRERWLLLQDGRSLSDGDDAGTNGREGAESVPVARRRAVRAVYERMADPGSAQLVRGQRESGGGAQRVGLLAVLRLFVRLLRPGRRRAAQAHHVARRKVTAGTVQFRVKR
jgi:hypothetical protein